jgi:hypothetical protein
MPERHCFSWSLYAAVPLNSPEGQALYVNFSRLFSETLASMSEKIGQVAGCRLEQRPRILGPRAGPAAGGVSRFAGRTKYGLPIAKNSHDNDRASRFIG